jgi:hypothetical protein
MNKKQKIVKMDLETKVVQYTKIGLMIIGLILFGAYLLK